MATVTISPPRSRPLVELLLLVLAIAAGLGGYILTSLNRTDALPANIGMHAAILVVFAIVADLGVRKLAPHADPVILPMAVGLTGIGLAMIYRLDMSYKIMNDSLPPESQYPIVGIKQLIFVAVGLVAAAVILIVI